jgi:hypothetical protein
MQRCELGKTYKDAITGFRGVAVSRSEYLSTEARVGLQAPVDDKGKLEKIEYFDEPRLIEQI